MMRLPELVRKSGPVRLEPGREGLLQFLMQYRPQGSPRNRVTVVFDGFAQIQANWARLRQEGIRLLFSEGESADDFIVKKISSLKDAPETWVVTDDRELTLRLYRTVEVMPAASFISGILTKKEETSEEKKSISPKAEREITDELKKIWLKKT